MVSEENTIREGVAEATNYFYNLNARYNKLFNSRHALNVMAGFQAMTTLQEYDGAYARNTTNDFYQVLGSANAVGRYFDGYQNKWNWANIYAHVDYTYNNVLNTASIWQLTVLLPTEDIQIISRYIRQVVPPG